VLDEVNQEIAQAIVRALAQAPPEPQARARAALAAGLAVVTDDPGKGRLVVASMTHSGALARRRADVVEAFAQIVAAQVRDLAHEPAIPDRLIEMAAVLLVGGVTELVGRWLAGAIDASPEQLVDDCATLLVAAGEAVARGALQ
jgi:AcrR family transcriptional regulator